MILTTIGFIRGHELKTFLQATQLSQVQDLIVIPKEDWERACESAGIVEWRIKRLWKGLMAFRLFYHEKVIELDDNESKFSPTTYNNVIHTMRLDEFTLENERPTPQGVMSQLKLNDNHQSISPLQSEDDMKGPTFGSTSKRSGPAPIISQKKVDVLEGSPNVDRPSQEGNQELIPEPLPGPTLDPSPVLAPSAPVKPTQLSMQTTDPQVLEIMQVSPNISVDDAVKILSVISPPPPLPTIQTQPTLTKTTPKKVSWDQIMEKDGGDDGDDSSSSSSESSDSDPVDPSDSSSTSSSESESESDSEMEGIQISAFKLSDFSNMKIPQLPIGKRDYEAFIRQLMNRLAMTGSDTLVHLDKDKRASKPIRKRKKDKDGFVTRESKKKFAKRRLKYKKKDKTILLILKEMANNAKHYLAKDLQRFDSGVKAFDFLVEKMDPMSIDPTNENADAFEQFQKLELTSIATGTFSKFYSLFQHQVTELVDTQGVSFTDDYLKSLLISKLKHESYAQMKLPSATRNDYNTYVKELRQFSVIIERAYKSSIKAHINVSESEKTGECSDTVKEINGVKVNSKGYASHDAFSAMSKEERIDFLNKRRSLINEGKIEADEGSKPESSKSKDSESNKVKKLQSKINKLKKELKDAKPVSESDKHDEKDGDIDPKVAIINNVKAANMEPGTKEKVLAYLEKHIQ